MIRTSCGRNVDALLVGAGHFVTPHRRRQHIGFAGRTVATGRAAWCWAVCAVACRRLSRYVAHCAPSSGQPHTDRARINVTLNALTRPPPIGCLEWPAGRVLLQWCLDCLPLRNATILEIGSGIGTTPRSDWPSPTTASAPHAEWLLPMRTTKSLTCSVPTPR